MMFAIAVLSTVCLSCMSPRVSSDASAFRKMAEIYSKNHVRNIDSAWATQLDEIDIVGADTCKEVLKKLLEDENNCFEYIIQNPPGYNTQKQLYAVRVAMRDQRHGGNSLEALLGKSNLDRKLLFQNLCEMVAMSYLNKNERFDLSNIDLGSSRTHTLDDELTAILICETLFHCKKRVYGILHMTEQPKYHEAWKTFNAFPKINARSYFTYAPVSLEDFQIESGSYKQSRFRAICSLLNDHRIAAEATENQEEAKQIVDSSLLALTCE